MSSKKDMRREDLSEHPYWKPPSSSKDPPVIPYKDPSTKKEDNDIASTMATTLPMIAVSGLSDDCTPSFG
jgi:hypothetical protein